MTGSKARVCCICGAYTSYRRKGSRSFFQFPKLTANEVSLSLKNVVERRIAAWKNVVGRNLGMHYGIQCVCSDHFHSGVYRYSMV